MIAVDAYRVFHNGTLHAGTVFGVDAVDALHEFFGVDDFEAEPGATVARATIVLHDGAYTAERWEPALDTPAWREERALRGLRALRDGDVDVVREVLETLRDDATRAEVQR